MTQNRKPKHIWLRLFLEVTLAVVIGMIATALFVAWIAAKSGAPVPMI